ncbi:unnamed protein product [Calypogeia fissa]
MLSRLEREKCVKEEESKDSVAGRKVSRAAQAWQGMTPEEEVSFKAAGGISRGEASSYRNFDYLNQLADVEGILSKRFVTHADETKTAYYLVKWQDSPVAKSTWEPCYGLKDAQGLVDEFERKGGNLYPQVRPYERWQPEEFPFEKHFSRRKYSGKYPDYEQTSSYLEPREKYPETYPHANEGVAGLYAGYKAPKPPAHHESHPLEVEMVLSKRWGKEPKESVDCCYYLVKWKDFPLKESTWEPCYNLQGAMSLVDEFEATGQQESKFYPRIRPYYVREWKGPKGFAQRAWSGPFPNYERSLITEFPDQQEKYWETCVSELNTTGYGILSHETYTHPNEKPEDFYKFGELGRSPAAPASQQKPRGYDGKPL